MILLHNCAIAIVLICIKFRILSMFTVSYINYFLCVMLYFFTGAAKIALLVIESSGTIDQSID